MFLKRTEENWSYVRCASHLTPALSGIKLSDEDWPHVTATGPLNSLLLNQMLIRFTNVFQEAPVFVEVHIK
jgi:hypothetical protein